MTGNCPKKTNPDAVKIPVIRVRNRVLRVGSSAKTDGITSIHRSPTPHIDQKQEAGVRTPQKKKLSYVYLSSATKSPFQSPLPYSLENPAANFSIKRKKLLAYKEGEEARFFGGDVRRVDIRDFQSDPLKGTIKSRYLNGLIFLDR